MTSRAMLGALLLGGVVAVAAGDSEQCHASPERIRTPSALMQVGSSRKPTELLAREAPESKEGVAHSKHLTVVVTGAAGYIGSHAVLSLLAGGYRVVGVDNLSRGYMETVKTLEAEAASPRYAHAGGFKFYQVDLGVEKRFEEVLQKERPAAVLHFAGVAYAGESAADPLRYYKNNTFNTMKVATAMANAGIKNLVYSSSCATYGSPTEMPVTEETPQVPVSAYGRSKLQAEGILKDWELQQNADGPEVPLRVVLMRYFNVIGADPEGRVGERRPAWLDAASEDYRLYVRLSTALFDAAGGLLPKFTVAGGKYDTNDGTAMRDYVHVVDVVDAHVAVLKTLLHGSGQLPNLRYYNVGTGKAYSVREMVDAAKLVTGIDFPVEVGGGRATDPPAVWADPSKLRTEAGWRPRFLNLTETLGHEWNFRLRVQKSGAIMVQRGAKAVRADERRAQTSASLADTELIDESGLSVAILKPNSEAR